MRILRVRHAPVLVSGLCYGQSEVAAAIDAKDAAGWVRAQLAYTRPSRVFSSPFIRTRALAEVLAADLGAALVIDPRLSELSFGEWEQRRWDALEREDGARFSAWMTDYRHASPPGGECVDDLVARIRAWRADLREETVLAVTHAGPIRAMRADDRGVDFTEVVSERVEHLVVEG